MTTRIAACSLAAVAAFMLALPLYGQEGPDDPVRIWIYGGMGGGDFSSRDGQTNDPGIALLAGVAASRAAHRFTLRGAVVAEILGDGIADLGLLYGRTWTGERSQRSLSAGVALVEGEDCHGIFSGRPCEDVNKVGLPLSASVSFRPVRMLGLGLEAFGNLNTLSSFAGVAAIIELGSLR